MILSFASPTIQGNIVEANGTKVSANTSMIRPEPTVNSLAPTNVTFESDPFQASFLIGFFQTSSAAVAESVKI